MLWNVIKKNEEKNTDLVIQNRLALRVVYLGSPCPIAQAFSVGISWYRPKQKRDEHSVLIFKQPNNFMDLRKR